MAHGAAALGRTAEGQVIFVDDALPGEHVLAEVTRRKRSFLNARAVEVLEPSPHRVAPPCPYVPECGGCQWQHASYQGQLEQKARVLAATMRRGGARVPEAEVIAAPEAFRYRIRGEFSLVAPGSRGYGLGFTRRGSWNLIAVDDCLIHHPHLTAALPGIRRALDAAGAGTMRSLHLTANPGRRELLWQARGGEDPAGFQAALAAELSEYLVHQDSMSLEYDGAAIDGREGQPLVFRVDSDSFVQVNHAQAHRLYGRALAYLGDRPGRVLEGYAGLGAISVMAGTRPDPATRPKSITLVEEARASAVLGRLHLRMHGLDGSATYQRGAFEEVLHQFEAGSFDSVVVDPPRAGCAPEALAGIAHATPERIVYVSCDPATLARDLERLAQLGYRVEAQTLVDMFPQTYHIESVTLLLRQAGAGGID
ncbi:MAG TPA: class I SAM-dependent RNA methyltransferase [Candidatus Dormibacteraeota bacterium]|jgi:23S rRNA (uracil1939-C5)-methyltransferase|nr:class I SAM-dependent RNA methyltransferase [Candidatus Dormibacteraeota bacterium]